MMKQMMLFHTSEEKSLFAVSQAAAEKFFSGKPESFTAAYAGKYFVRKECLVQVARGVFRVQNPE